jgi:pimeloyl-ACP methyl ester carboxylesterase
MPVLLLHGSRSPVVANQVVQELSKRLTNARVQTIADAGHMAPALAPTRLEGPLLAWFGQQV